MKKKAIAIRRKYSTQEEEKFRCIWLLLTLFDMVGSAGFSASIAVLLSKCNRLLDISDKWKRHKSQSDQLTTFSKGFCVASVLLLVFLYSGCAGPKKSSGRLIDNSERVTHYGLSLPFPVNFPRDSVSWRPQRVSDTTISYLLTINKKGAVILVNSVEEDMTDSSGLQYARRLFESMDFVPGLVKGKKRKTVLVIDISFRRGSMRPITRFPLTLEGQVYDEDFYIRSLIENNICPPSLVSFPKYFATHMLNTDESDEPTLLMAEITLDSTGRPTAILPLVKRGDVQVEQLLTACNWAEYLPGKGIAEEGETRALLTIEFFSEIEYPQSLVLGKDGNNGLLRSLGVQLRPVWSELPVLPVPRNLNEGRLVSPGPSNPFVGKLNAYVYVDSAGEVSLLGSGGLPRGLIYGITQALDGLRFYPAIGSDGKARSYRGELVLELDGSKFIRVTCKWLTKRRSLIDRISQCQ